MRNALYKLLSYTSAFMLGAYATSEFKFNQPVESYRWVIGVFFFVFFVAMSNRKDK